MGLTDGLLDYADERRKEALAKRIAAQTAFDEQNQQANRDLRMNTTRDDVLAKIIAHAGRAGMRPAAASFGAGDQSLTNELSANEDKFNGQLTADRRRIGAANQMAMNSQADRFRQLLAGAPTVEADRDAVLADDARRQAKMQANPAGRGMVASQPFAADPAMVKRRGEFLEQQAAEKQSPQDRQANNILNALTRRPNDPKVITSAVSRGLVPDTYGTQQGDGLGHPSQMQGWNNLPIAMQAQLHGDWMRETSLNRRNDSNNRVQERQNTIQSQDRADAIKARDAAASLNQEQFDREQAERDAKANGTTPAIEYDKRRSGRTSATRPHEVAAAFIGQHQVGAPANKLLETIVGSGLVTPETYPLVRDQLVARGITPEQQRKYFQAQRSRYSVKPLDMIGNPWRQGRAWAKGEDFQQKHKLYQSFLDAISGETE